MNNTVNTTKPRLKKNERRAFLEFFNRLEVREVLIKLPRIDRKDYIIDAFFNETGIRITNYMYFKIKNKIAEEVRIGNSSYLI